MIELKFFFASKVKLATSESLQLVESLCTGRNTGAGRG